MLDTKKTDGSVAADRPVQVPPVPEDLDQTPPPDHEEFVAFRNAGLRAMREHLERRRKRR